MSSATGGPQSQEESQHLTEKEYHRSKRECEDRSEQYRRRLVRDKITQDKMPPVISYRRKDGWHYEWKDFRRKHHAVSHRGNIPIGWLEARLDELELAQDIACHRVKIAYEQYEKARLERGEAARKRIQATEALERRKRIVYGGVQARNDRVREDRAGDDSAGDDSAGDDPAGDDQAKT